MTNPDRLDKVLTELEGLRSTSTAISITVSIWEHWPFLRAKLRAAMEMEKALRQAPHDSLCIWDSKLTPTAKFNAGRCDRCKSLTAWQQAEENNRRKA